LEEIAEKQKERQGERGYSLTFICLHNFLPLIRSKYWGPDPVPAVPLTYSFPFIIIKGKNWKVGKRRDFFKNTYGINPHLKRIFFTQKWIIYPAKNVKKMCSFDLFD
jgi:hypothetical protein